MNLVMSLVTNPVMNPQCYNFTIPIASIDHFDLVVIREGFILSPKKVLKVYFLQKFPTKKVVTPLKIFLGVIQNFWHSQNACEKKKSTICLRHSVTANGKFFKHPF